MSTTTAQAEELGIGTKMVPIARIKVVRNQRHEVGDVQPLADSMRQHGLLQALVVSPDGDDFELVAGERRLAAAALLNWKEIEVKVKTRDALDRALAQLDENDKRLDLNPLERAEAIQGLLELGLPVEEVPTRTGYPANVVSASLDVLSLPVELRAAYARGEMELLEGREYAKVAAYPDRLQAAIDLVADFGWSVDAAVRRQLEAIKHEGKVARARARIEKLGLRELPPEQQDQLGRYASLGKEARQVNISAKAHRKLDCHAAWIDRAYKVRELCVNPESHGDLYNRGALSTLPVNYALERAMSSAQKAAQTRAANKLLRAAIEPRRAVIRRLMTGEIEADGGMAWVRDMVLATHQDDLDFAATVMGLPAPELPDQRGFHYMSQGARAFHLWVQTVTPEQALIAFLLARAEGALSNTKAIHSGYLQEPVRIAAAATVALLDAQEYPCSEGDTKARELLHLGEFAREIPTLEPDDEIGDQADAQDEGEVTTG